MSLVSEVLLLVLPLNIFFAIYIHGSVISKYDFIKFNVLKIRLFILFYLLIIVISLSRLDGMIYLG
jgi:hypothetical protein